MWLTPSNVELEKAKYGYKNYVSYDRVCVNRIFIDTDTIGTFIHGTSRYEQGVYVFRDKLKIRIMDFSEPWDGVEFRVRR